MASCFCFNSIILALTSSSPQTSATQQQTVTFCHDTRAELVGLTCVSYPEESRPVQTWRLNLHRWPPGAQPSESMTQTHYILMSRCHAGDFLAVSQYKEMLLHFRCVSVLTKGVTCSLPTVHHTHHLTSDHTLKL